MASVAAKKLDADLRAWAASLAEQDTSLESMRAGAEGMSSFGTERDDVAVTQVQIGELRALKHVPGAAGEGVVLYLHGGGLTMGSPESHARLVDHLAATSAMTVYNLDYRLAPEHPFPAALDDAAAALEWLFEQGVEPHRIFLAGDSGGGALALSTLVDMTAAGSLLAGGILLSPWADFTMRSDTYASNAESDVLCSRAMMLPLRDNYCPSGDFENPRVSSAATGDLAGLPPLMIQASAAEVLVGDARLIAQRGRAAGVDVTYQEYEVVPHVFQLFAGNLDEADESLRSIAEWAAGVLDR